MKPSGRKFMEWLISLLNADSDHWVLPDRFSNVNLHSCYEWSIIASSILQAYYLTTDPQEVPEKTKESPGDPWQLVGLLALFDPPRHDSAETIRRALNLGVNVKMITGMCKANITIFTLPVLHTNSFFCIAFEWYLNYRGPTGYC